MKKLMQSLMKKRESFKNIEKQVWYIIPNKRYMKTTNKNEIWEENSYNIQRPTIQPWFQGQAPA